MYSTEESILIAIKNKDKDAMELLFKRFYRPLVMYAKQYLDRDQEAEDLVQDVFVKLWEKDALLRVQDRLYAYMYTAVRNACINKLEQLDKVKYESLDNIQHWIEEDPIDEEVWMTYLDKIYHEIEKLPLRTQQIFRAIVIDKRKYKDVACEMNISVNTIKTTLGRAFQKLRTHFKEDDMALLILLYLSLKL